MKIEESLEYLAESADDYALWRGRMLALEYLLKVAEAEGYLGSTGTQETRKSAARISQKYKDMIEDYEEAVVKYTEIQSKRKSAELSISWAQSKIKADGQGTVV